MTHPVSKPVINPGGKPAVDQQRTRAGRFLRSAAVVGLVGIAVGACSNSAFESQPVDQDTSTSSSEPAESNQTATDRGPAEELALVVESPYQEPDLDAVVTSEEIAEDSAEEPADEPTQSDPDDTADVTQVALGNGESALCGTVQIGRDAITDGNTDLVASQQAMLIDRADLIADNELAELIGGVDDGAPLQAAILDAALTRCEDLGYQP